MTEGSDSRIEWTNSLNTNPQQPRKQTDFFLILFCVITMSLVTIIPACIKLPLQQRTRTLNFDGTKTVAAHYTLSLKHIKISLNFCQFGKRYTDMRWPPKLIKAHDLECKLWRSWVSPDFKATQHQSGMKFVYVNVFLLFEVFEGPNQILNGCFTTLVSATANQSRILQMMNGSIALKC
eukprot:GHVL01004778.1.p1 GENE.GHVL01004778.1~~GHVL01004778.1.p1  ORF type:complete len:179 (+),score=17.13 GHVL01004778.1:133-669(+)